MSCPWNLKKVAEYESPKEEALYEGPVKKYTAAQRAMINETIFSTTKDRKLHAALRVLEKMNCDIGFPADPVINFKWFMVTKYPTIFKKWLTTSSPSEIVSEIMKTPEKFLHKITYTGGEELYTALGRPDYPSQRFRTEVLRDSTEPARPARKSTKTRRSAKAACATASTRRRSAAKPKAETTSTRRRSAAKPKAKTASTRRRSIKA
jgi:hypothetical protein